MRSYTRVASMGGWNSRLSQRASDAATWKFRYANNSAKLGAKTPREFANQIVEVRSSRSMEEMPAFNVRGKTFCSWPLYRVYVGRDELYLIRVRWVFGLTRGGRVHMSESGTDGCFALLVILPVIAVLAGLGWWTKSVAVRRLDAYGPAWMLGDHASNLQVEPGEVEESRLDPPSRAYDGPHSASWSLTIRGQKPLIYYIEDEAALQTALEHLPRLLGKALTVNVGQRG